MRKRQQTERLTTAILYAGEEAKQLGHDVVDARHLLVGLLRERDNVAAIVLRNEGVTLKGARGVFQATAAGAAGVANVPAVQTVLADAWRLSKSLHQDHLGSEHVLLATATGEGTVPLLEKRGVQPARVRTDLLTLIGGTEPGCSNSAAAMH